MAPCPVSSVLWSRIPSENAKEFKIFWSEVINYPVIYVFKKFKMYGYDKLDFSFPISNFALLPYPKKRTDMNAVKKLTLASLLFN